MSHVVNGPRHLSKLKREIHIQMMKLVAEAVNVAEIYSPPRVVARAKRWGLNGGWGLGLTTKGHDGKNNSDRIFHVSKVVVTRQ